MSGSFGKSDSKSSSTPIDITPREYRPLRGATAGFLFDALQGGPQYQGPFVAPIRSEEQAGISGINRFVTGDNPLRSASRAQLEQTLSGQFLNPESNPFLQGAIRAASRPVLEDFELRGLERGAAFANAGQNVNESSPFAFARAIDDRSRTNALVDIGARLTGENFQAERGRQIQAVQAATQLDQAELERQVENLRVQALPRLIEDLGIERGIAEFQRRVAVALQAAGITADLTTLFGNQQRSTSSTRQYGVDVGEASLTKVI